MATKYLSKTDILDADDIATETVDVPEWGGAVLVRAMTGTERDRFEFALAAARKSTKPGTSQVVRAQMVARCLVDDDGKRIFTDGDVVRLGGKSAKALDRLFDVAARLAGMNDEATDEAVEDFGTAPSDSSPSD